MKTKHRQQPRLRVAQQQKQLRRLLQFLRRVNRVFERRAGDDRAMIGEHHGVVRGGKSELQRVEGRETAEMALELRALIESYGL